MRVTDDSIQLPDHVAEIQLSYRTKRKPNVNISRSEDAHVALAGSWSQDIEFVEEFKILLLNRLNNALGIVNISKGGTAGTVADSRLIFAAAIKANASGIILAHNHPSGNLVSCQSCNDGYSLSV